MFISLIGRCYIYQWYFMYPVINTFGRNAFMSLSKKNFFLLDSFISFLDDHITTIGQPRWLSGLRRSRVHSLMIARRSLCPEKLRSNPGHGSKGINFSGWHGLDMSITVTKRR